MTSTPEEFLSGHGETPRDGHGRYLMKGADGEVRGRTRATTFADTLANPFGLHNWELRTAVHGMAMRPDLVAMAASADPDRDKSTLREVAKAAFEYACPNHKRPNYGTGVHMMIAAIARGTMSIEQVPADTRPDVEAYFREMARLGIVIRTEWMERTVYNPTYDTGGTFDNIYEMPDACVYCGSNLRIGDTKTGQNLDYGELEYAIQLAQYAYADRMFEPGSQENFVPMPPVCKHFGLIIEVAHGTGECHVWNIDIGRGWWASRIAAEAREWRATKGIRTPYIPNPAHPAVSATVPQIAAAIQADPSIGTVTAVGQPWQPGTLAQAMGADDPVTAFLSATVPDDEDEPVADPVMGHGTGEPTGFLNVPGVRPIEGPYPAAGEPMTEAQQRLHIAERQGAPDEVIAELEADVRADTPADSLPSMKDFNPKNPDPVTEALFLKLKKSKPKLQDLARKLMNTDHSVPIKLEQYAIKIAAEIVRHPAWSRVAGQVMNAPDTGRGRPKKTDVADQPPTEAINASGGGETFEPAQSAQIAANLIGSEVNGAVPKNTPANPFIGATAPEPAYDVDYYRAMIRQAMSKQDLAALYKDYGTRHGKEWPAELNALGMSRLNEINAGG